MNNYKIGFCCKWLDSDRTKSIKNLAISEKPMNQRETTLTALRAMSNIDAVDKVSQILVHNCETLWRQLQWLAKQPPELRLFRITSNFVPVATLVEYKWLVDLPVVRNILVTGLNGVREFADKHQIRLCSHPGQFTNICSTSDSVVSASIEDLEYHADLASLMGYGDTFHSSGFAINIHANYRQDPGLTKFLDVIQNKVSPTVRNLITLENDEFSCSVNQLIQSGIYKHVSLVLDIHHHWIQSAGEYIPPDDPRIEFFKESWRDIRPLSHFSTSSTEILKEHDITVKPDFATLFLAGHKPGKLRSHSYYCWNSDVNAWAASHLTWTDIEVEAKAKNLAALQLYKSVKGDK